MKTLKGVAEVLCIMSSTAFAAHAGEGPRPEYGPDITHRGGQEDRRAAVRAAARTASGCVRRA